MHAFDTTIARRRRGEKTPSLILRAHSTSTPPNQQPSHSHCNIEIREKLIPVQGKIGNKREISNFQTRKFKITSYYSRHYSNSAATIQIRGTIQNIRYYSNSEYEQENPTHKVDEPLQEVSSLCTVLGNNQRALSNSAWLSKYGHADLFYQNVSNFKRQATFWIPTKQVPNFFSMPTFWHDKFWFPTNQDPKLHMSAIINVKNQLKMYTHVM